MTRIFYIVSSVKMVIELIKIIDSDFFARVISRGLILRIEDFIKLVRIYNNSQISNKSLKKELKNKLNNLDNEFTKSLKIQRDKYSGHIQDLSFKDRINLWQDINKEKIFYFYDEIINTYKLLESEKEYIKLEENQFIIEEEILENINMVVSNHNIENKPYMSNDILSMTRGGCGVIIPCHPIQDKMATIKAIELMINFEIDLFSALKSDEDYSLLLKTLIITDLISYIDNIKHRKKSQDIGIAYLFQKDIFPLISFSFSIVKPSKSFLLKRNSLIKTHSSSRVPLSIIDKFIESYKLASIKEIRKIRNKIGAHIDNNITEIKEFCESKDFEVVIKVYNDFKNLIKKVCLSELHLHMFSMEPSLINGITAMDNNGCKDNTFFGESIIKEYDEIRYLFKNDYLKYKEYIDSIVDEETFESRRSFFYETFMHSDIQEELKYENYELKIRRLHRYFIELLNSGKNDLNTKKIMLRIMENCSSGSPKELVYILLETYESNKEHLLIEYIKCFSSIGSYHMFDEVYNILVNNISSSDCYIRFLSISALLNTDINTRGIDCINKKLKVNKNKYVEIIHSSLNQLNPFCKVVLSVLLMSQLKFPFENSYLRFFKEIYYNFFEMTFILGLSSLEINFTDKEFDDIEESNSQYFFTKSLLIIAEKLENEQLSKFIYGVISENVLKVNAQYTPFLEHQAYCHYKLDNIDESIKIYEYLSNSNPDYVEFSLTLIDYLYEKNDMKKIQEIVYFIEERYFLSKENLERFNLLKSKLENS